MSPDLGFLFFMSNVDNDTTTGSFIEIPASPGTAIPLDYSKVLESYMQPVLPRGIQIANPIHTQPLKVAYQSQAKQRISIPIRQASSPYAPGASLEMTTGQGDGDNVEFTVILPGRQAFSFTAHRKDLEAFTAELTLAKLSQ